MTKALRCFLIFTLVTGVLYPLFITTLSHLTMKDKAQGSQAFDLHHRQVGSFLIGQKFEQPGYFWSRPSACDYHTLPSYGSNLGPTSKKLRSAVIERKNRFPLAQHIPSDLLFASGSGLDPHITPQTALFQVERIATFRGIEASKIEALIEQLTEERQGGFLGAPRINVLKLNLELDELQ